MFAWLERMVGRHKTPPSDRRTAIRRKTKVDGHLVAAIGVGWPAVVKAISCQEVDLVVGLLQKVGAPLTVRLKNRETGQVCPVQTRVTRTRLQRDGSWKLSCTFDRMLEAPEMTALALA